MQIEQLVTRKGTADNFVQETHENVLSVRVASTARYCIVRSYSDRLTISAGGLDIEFPVGMLEDFLSEVKSIQVEVDQKVS
jgi:hypothetical protein